MHSKKTLLYQSNCSASWSLFIANKILLLHVHIISPFDYFGQHLHNKCIFTNQKAFGACCWVITVPTGHKGVPKVCAACVQHHSLRLPAPACLHRPVCECVCVCVLQVLCPLTVRASPEEKNTIHQCSASLTCLCACVCVCVSVWDSFSIVLRLSVTKGTW